MEISAPSATQTRPSNATYLVFHGVLLAFGAALFWLTRLGSHSVDAAASLLPPVFSLVGLTAVAWLLMLIARNLAVFFEKASVRYYQDYTHEVPDERIERPARLFNNLLQVPVLFYVLCVLMIATGSADSLQGTLAWLFVATRLVHAAVYLALNHVPTRLCAWLCGCLVLGVMWTRFALAVPLGP